MELVQYYLTFWLVLLGAVMGSFLDCAAVRGKLPTGRSRCDSCGHPLGAKDLVPLFSYLLCRGRCRYCGSPIPARCLGAELAGALVFGALGWKFGLSLELVMELILGSLLLLLTLIDWVSHTLPDKLLLAAGINRLVFLFLLQQPLKETCIDMILGAFSVSLPLLILSLVMDHLLQKETMGGGDIKLLFVLGLYLNWMEMVLLLFLGCVLALAWALGTGKGRSPKEIPFGPFLSAAWLIVTLFGTSWIQWYESLLM